MLLFISHDGTITSVDGDGMTLVTGTPYSPKTQEERNEQSNRDYYATQHAWMETQKAKHKAKEEKQKAKEANKASKKAQKASKKAQKAAVKAKNQSVNGCCVIL